MTILRNALSGAALAAALLAGCGGGNDGAAGAEADLAGAPGAARAEAKSANLAAERATAYAPAEPATAFDAPPQDTAQEPPQSAAAQEPATAWAAQEPAAAPAAPPARALGAPQKPAPGKMVLAYYSGYSYNYRALTRHVAHFNSVALDFWNITSHGSVVGNGDPAPNDAIAFLKARQIDAYACISNVDSHARWNATIASGVTGKYRAAAVANLVGFAQRRGLAGINIDFENVAATDRLNLSKFSSALAKALHAAGMKLIMTVPAFSALDEQHPYNAAFDLAALGASADFIQIMTYDESIPAWDPGPVASSPWTRAALGYAVAKAPAGKILSGIPAYGYNWSGAGGGTQLFWRGVPALLKSHGITPRYDSASDALTFEYNTKTGVRHTVWTENATSVTRKAALVRGYGLAGTSVYALGMEDASFWSALDAGLRD